MKNAPNRRRAFGALAVSLAALFIAYPGMAGQPGAELCISKPLAAELKPLQGLWEGEGAGGKCSITIEGNTLLYRNSGGWFKTTFTLPPATNPRQLHATITECSPPSKESIGTVVAAIFKIEDGTLTIETSDKSEKAPDTFQNESNRYTVKKVQPQKNKPEPSAPK